MKKIILLLSVFLILVLGCSTLPAPQESVTTTHKIEITLKQIDGHQVAVVAKTAEGEKVVKSMEVSNPGLSLSQLSGIPKSGDVLFIKIFSGLSVSDVTRMWNDLIYIENQTNIKNVEMFIDSPGGDAFSGLALADQIQKYQKKGFRFVCHATGIIASAAVPVFAVCNETHATPATIFMVHEAALWKWPGRETASDIRSQGKLMDLLQKLYIEKLVENSNLSFDQWVLKEAQTSWFSVSEAIDMGLLDHID